MVERVAKLRSHLSVPLYRNAYALMASGLSSAGLGVLFWAIASRSYGPEVVGLSSASVAALMFVTGVAGLYLDAALYRFLPRAGDATGTLLSATSILTLVAAVVVSLVFLAGVDLWAPALSFANSSPWFLLACVGATAASCLLVLQDGALTGLRRTTWVPVKNVVYSVAKILVLVAVAGRVSRYGILVAWVLPSLVIVPVTAYLLTNRLVPRHREISRTRPEPINARGVSRYAAGNYVGFLCMLAYRNIPPLLVIHEAGARASAFFYPPWLIATSLGLLTTNLSVSLVVEGAFERNRLAVYGRQALRQSARLLVPIAIVLFFGAEYVLRIFGPTYADKGTTLLRLLALGLLPNALCVLGFGVARVQDNIRAIIAGQALLAALVLGLSALLLPSFGIEGVGVGWIIAQTAVGLILFCTQLAPALTGRPRPRMTVASEAGSVSLDAGVVGSTRDSAEANIHPSPRNSSATQLEESAEV